MVNLCRFACLLLFAMSLFAGGNTNQDTITAGPCVHLRNPEHCVNYQTGECFWDEADQRCENRYNREDRCSLIDDVDNCIYSHLGCFWDHDDQRCERRE